MKKQLFTFTGLLIFLLAGCKTPSLVEVIESKYGSIGPAKSTKEYYAKKARGIQQDAIIFKEQPFADIKAKDFEE